MDLDQVGRLFAAGSVRIPPHPDDGLVSVDGGGIVVDGGAEPSVTVVHYSSPAHKCTYQLALAGLTAIYLPDGLAAAAGLPAVAGPQWIVGRALAAGNASVHRLTLVAHKGAVFAREAAGVIVSSETAMTASDVAAMPKSCA